MASISRKKTLQAAKGACFISLSSNASNVRLIHSDHDSIFYPIHGIKIKLFKTLSVGEMSHYFDG